MRNTRVKLRIGSCEKITRTTVYLVLLCLEIAHSVCIRGQSLVPPLPGAEHVLSDRLQEDVLQLVHEKIGVSYSARLGVDIIRDSANPDFIEVRLSVSQGPNSYRKWIGISKDGKLFINGRIFKLRDNTQDEILSRIRSNLKVPSDEPINLDYSTRARGDGYKAGFATASLGHEKIGVGFYLSPSGRYIIIGDLYTVLSPSDTVKCLSRLDKTRVPILGNHREHSTIVIFSDFECPTCAADDPDIQKLSNELAQHAHRGYRFVFAEFPLPYHPWAYLAAEVDACVFRTQRRDYLPFRSLLFGQQEQIHPDHAREDIAKLLSGVGLDPKTIMSCVDSGYAVNAIKTSMEVGNKIGIAGTPTIYVSGNGVMGNVSLDDLHKLLERANE